jgi:hypothetical protein
MNVKELKYTLKSLARLYQVKLKFIKTSKCGGYCEIFKNTISLSRYFRKYNDDWYLSSFFHELSHIILCSKGYDKNTITVDR